MRFEFIAGSLCLDYANTIHDYRAEDHEEELDAIADLLQWTKEAKLLSPASYDRLAAHYGRHPREAASAFTKAVAIRDLLLSLFAGIANDRPLRPKYLSDLNSALAEVPGRLKLSSDSGRIKAEWASASDGLQQALFAILKSAAELLADNRLPRVRECASNDCTWLFVDESRNRSRRWCDMRQCGNRMKARRHYKKGKATQ